MRLDGVEVGMEARKAGGGDVITISRQPRVSLRLSAVARRAGMPRRLAQVGGHLLLQWELLLLLGC